MRRRLKADELELLRSVVEKRQPELLPVVKSLGIEPLTPDQREELRGVLADEMVETGLRPNSEPNPRGLAIDDLIGLLGNYRSGVHAS